MRDNKSNMIEVKRRKRKKSANAGQRMIITKEILFAGVENLILVMLLYTLMPKQNMMVFFQKVLLH